METDKRILVVSDELEFLNSLKSLLDERFNITVAGSGVEGLAVIDRKGGYDLVVSDYLKPEIKGVEFFSKLKTLYPETVLMFRMDNIQLPEAVASECSVDIFRVFSNECSMELLGKILEKGLVQYDLQSSEKRKNDEVSAAYKQMVQYAKDLNNTVAGLKKNNEELAASYYDTINRLVIASEYKDEDTHDHIVRMSRYSALIAEKLGFTANAVTNMLFASPMHDVGKIGIPDAIMHKPGKLTAEEFDNIKTHTLIGAKILEDSNSDILKLAKTIALTHHERWDGNGYPHKLAESAIPLPGRIVNLADTFDALTTRRPYKDPYPVDVACKIIMDERGRQFEPSIVDIFLENIDEIIKISEEVKGSNEVSDGSFVLSERDS
jgi:putative two-component system response regulator